MRTGALAGKNPWNSDGLEWETDSPPKPYATAHIPTVISRHPLWDDHDEEADPNDDRLLDEARLTLTTSWLDARPLSVATMPGDSFLPLLFSLCHVRLLHRAYFSNDLARPGRLRGNLHRSDASGCGRSP